MDAGLFIMRLFWCSFCLNLSLSIPMVMDMDVKVSILYFICLLNLVSLSSIIIWSCLGQIKWLLKHLEKFIGVPKGHVVDLNNCIRYGVEIVYDNEKVVFPNLYKELCKDFYEKPYQEIGAYRTGKEIEYKIYDGIKEVISKRNFTDIYVRYMGTYNYEIRTVYV